jgi:hypothetical protein
VRSALELPDDPGEPRNDAGGEHGVSFGVLTLATPGDYRKAIGLALSLRVSNPGVPVAVACDPRLNRDLIAPFFDYVLDDDPTVRGFMHKVHLDRYSPFQDTFFFDSDVLVFRSLGPYVEEWSDQSYNACGIVREEGVSAFGLDFGRVRRMLGKSHLVDISGAGHAYFRKPGCSKVFELAREVSSNYPPYPGNVRYADEDVMNIVLTKLDIRPRPRWGFFSVYYSAVRGTLSIDASRGHCEMIERSTGKALEPVIMHFAANQGPATYAKELRRLFRKFGADPAGIYRVALEDFWDHEVKLRARHLARRVFARVMNNAK